MIIGNETFGRLYDQRGLVVTRIIKMSEALPKSWSAEVIGKQIIRSSSSVGSNYRAACQAKSTADMINKLKIVEEEADETLFWLELLVESELVTESRLKELINETDEILAMTVASINTLRGRNSQPSIVNRKSKI